jgi:hypothetical protein
MRLALKSCTIRPWQLDDAESLWVTARDLFPHPYTIDDAHEYLEMTLSEQPTTIFCIEIDGPAVGGIGVHPPTQGDTGKVACPLITGDMAPP